jgi:alkylhydroperoxidase family enzyme
VAAPKRRNGQALRVELEGAHQHGRPEETPLSSASCPKPTARAEMTDVTAVCRAVSSCPTGNEQEDTMTLRVPKAELPAELRETMIEQIGAVPEPLEVMWHDPAAAMTSLELGAKAREWRAVDESLKSFAHMAVAAQVGCSWCLDIGYFQALNEHLDAAKASQVPRWRESDVFSPLERHVLEYAEAMTTTPPTVTDELSARLLEGLGPAALVELTAYIAFSNFATRSNTALGIESQGFSDACEIPLARPEGIAPAA